MHEVCAECDLKEGEDEFLHCCNCSRFYHPVNCLDYNEKVVAECRTYAWRCGHCKTCEICANKHSDAQTGNLKLCNHCDRAYHQVCVTQAVKKPSGPYWKCPICEATPKMQSRAEAEAKNVAAVAVNVAAVEESRVTRAHLKRKASAEPTVPAEPIPPAVPDTNDSGSSRKPDESVCIELSPAVPTSQSGEVVKRKRGRPKGNSVSSQSALSPSGRLDILNLETVGSHQQQAENPNVRGSLISPSSQCPVVGCSGRGHMDGVTEIHNSFETCPSYHNLNMDECKELYWSRKKLIQKSRDTKSAVPLKAAARKLEEISDLRRLVAHSYSSRNSSNRLKHDPRRRSKSADVKTEPISDALSTAFDLNLFQQAQCQLAEDMEKDESLVSKRNSRVRLIQLGRYEIEPQYPSPYPEGMDTLHKLFLCEFCLKYLSSSTVLRRHRAKCQWLHPPGDEIYRKDQLSIWEVDGRKCKVYCQNLCLLAKLFLDHKTLYHDVEPFLFYVMTEADSSGCHIVGYFSKEKKSSMNCNLSCILVLPPFQRKRFGRLLIEFSYLLSKVEDRIGSPERPLSDLGLVSYRNYWKDAIIETILKTEALGVSIKDLSQETGIHVNDIVSTLQFLGMLKYFKGEYFLVKKQEVLDEYTKLKKKFRKEKVCIDPQCLSWHPHPETTESVAK